MSDPEYHMIMNVRESIIHPCLVNAFVVKSVTIRKCVMNRAQCEKTTTVDEEPHKGKTQIDS